VSALALAKEELSMRRDPSVIHEIAAAVLNFAMVHTVDKCPAFPEPIVANPIYHMQDCTRQIPYDWPRHGKITGCGWACSRLIEGICAMATYQNFSPRMIADDPRGMEALSLIALDCAVNGWTQAGLSGAWRDVQEAAQALIEPLPIPF
jgi:hypothetical protein